MSTKFSRSKHAFRSPDVCKKKRPPQPSGNPNPADQVESWYDIDISWFFYHYVFNGQLTINKIFDYTWVAPITPPTNGEVCWFMWYPAIEQFAASIQHFVAGVNVVTIVANSQPYPPEPNFNTGPFNYTSALYTGKMDGRIFNA